MLVLQIYRNSTRIRGIFLVGTIGPFLVAQAASPFGDQTNRLAVRLYYRYSNYEATPMATRRVHGIAQTLYYGSWKKSP